METGGVNPEAGPDASARIILNPKMALRASRNIL
jgi:hypothetical protein